jgi:hypothetical protein
VGDAGLGQGPGQAEVGHLHDSLRRHEDVLGFHVPVDDALLVGVLQRGQDLAHDLHGLRGLEGAVLPEERAEVGSPHELHHHEVGVAGAPPVVHGHDVRVREHGGRPGLATEAVDEVLVAGEGGVQHLQRHLAVEDGVVGAEHLSHPARRDAGEYLVASVYGRLDHRVRRGSGLNRL